MTCAAPSERTSSTLPVLHTPVTSAPSAAAIWTANVPIPPPAPMTSTRWPAFTSPTSRIPRSAVVAAMGTAAACSKVRLAGFGTTWSCAAHAYSAKAPRTRPSTSSPGRRSRTFAPTDSTTPAASTPATRVFGLVSPTPMMEPPAASSECRRHFGRDQRARPQQFVRVGHARADGHQACSRIDRVLDHGDLAVGVLGLTRNYRLHGRGFRRNGLANVGKIFLRHGEADVDGRSLIDRRHRCGVGLAHKIPDLDVGHADAAGNRCADRPQKPELDLQVFGWARLIRRRARHVDLRLRVVERDDGRSVREQGRCNARRRVAPVRAWPARRRSQPGRGSCPPRSGGVEREQRVAFSTRAPSRKSTPVIVVSTCVLMATAAMGVTVPRDSRRTGVDLRSAEATSTGTGRACACERAAAPSVDRNPRASTAIAIRASAALQ